MIQRIQSIFYVLAAACMGGLFFLPLASSNAAAEPFLSDKLYNIHDHIIMLIMAGLAIILPLIAMFMFKNRTLQLRLGIFSLIASVLFAVVAAVLFLNAGDELASNLQINDEAGVFLPFGSILFSIAANYFVKKDDKLVKSMDRLR